EVDLLVVDLHLREVGVDGGIERQAGCDVVLHIDADIPEPPRRHRPLARGDRLPEDVRHGLEVAEHRHGDTAHLAGERHTRQRELTGNGGPVRPLVAPTNVALEVHAPGLEAAGWIPQGLEGYLELRGPPDVADAGLHAPGTVPVQVEAAAR